MTIIEIYLWLNCLLYAGFAFICMVKPTTSAQFSGLAFLNHSGRSEYFALYVGLEASWAFMYAYCALHETWFQAGLFYSIILYSGVFIGRWISILQKNNGITKNTYFIALLEVLLGAWAIILFV